MLVCNLMMSTNQLLVQRHGHTQHGPTQHGRTTTCHVAVTAAATALTPGMRGGLVGAWFAIDDPQPPENHDRTLIPASFPFVNLSVTGAADRLGDLAAAVGDDEELRMALAATTADPGRAVHEPGRCAG